MNREEEIQYYTDIANKLTKIVSDIDRVKFANRDDLRQLGERAFNIIQSIENSQHINELADIETTKAIKLEDLRHTLGKEVEMCRETKQSESQRAKDDSLHQAKKYLTSDINGLVVILSHYNK